MDGGFDGLLDFVGYPVGAPAYAVPTGGGPIGLSTRLLYAYILEQQSRSVLDGAKENQQQRQLVLFARRVEENWMEYQRQLARQRDNSIFATLLAEI